MPQKKLPLPEKELPEPHDMLLSAKAEGATDAEANEKTTAKPLPTDERVLHAPTFWEKHGPAKWLVVGCLFVFLALTSLYLFLTRREAGTLAIPSPSPAPTMAQQAPIENDLQTAWRTYKDDEAGFTFQYPASYQISEKANKHLKFGKKGIDYLLVDTKPVDYSIYSKRPCSANPAPDERGFILCLDDQGTWGQSKSIEQTTLGGIPAISLYVHQKKNNDLHVVKMTKAPYVGLVMYVTRKGQEDTVFKKVLETFALTGNTSGEMSPPAGGSTKGKKRALGYTP